MIINHQKSDFYTFITLRLLVPCEANAQASLFVQKLRILINGIGLRKRI
jgi:hypothetical protein